ncbi:MAG: hypothetical protein WD055_04190 [Candidatus Dependentiae bacterium]
MKKIILFLILFYAHIEAISPGRANQLRTEFNQIGIYNPSNPGNYNEQRADEILNELNTGGFRGMGKRLRIQQLESLRLRPTAPQPSRSAPPTRAVPVHPRVITLQQQNEQLRNQIQQLQQQNNQLRQQHASVSEAQSASNEVIRLALQVIDATNKLNSDIGQVQVYLGLNDTESASATIDSVGTQFDQLQAIKEQLEQLIQR